MPTDAFSATYSDWKLIRTRAVVQIVLEVPVEQADHAYNVLGGMPNSSKEIWVGVARFKPGTEVMPNTGEPQSASSKPDKTVPALDSTTPARARKSWHEMPPAQQAGILCADKSFQKFLGGYIVDADGPIRQKQTIDEGFAAQAIRSLCKVRSRTEITRDNSDWTKIVTNYRAWMREPKIVP